MRSFLTSVRTPAAVRDTGLLIGRALLGVVLIAHGLQKFNDLGLDGVEAMFEKSGVPLPALTAPAVAALEVGGGALLIAGLLTSLVSALVALDMLGAWWFVHKDGGLFVSEGGWELVAMIGAAAVALAAVGAGRFSIDHATSRLLRSSAV
ncbi:DoxX family protein [Luteipulveratus halotolerans]|uniref:Membrane protein n=1 Tax=Luteipulveratus halotolerans TaxID=1631356 RepID=A0A0L6CLX1_9MICO|nr:DoxX family protein [Luteipulveratus halotolerans]KNX38518.1 membrane protein [Luteipulveratus halotolerans]